MSLFEVLTHALFISISAHLTVLQRLEVYIKTCEIFTNKLHQQNIYVMHQQNVKNKMHQQSDGLIFIYAVYAVVIDYANTICINKILTNKVVT